LRYLNADDPKAVTRLHQRIALVLGDQLPSQAEEDANRDAADRGYWEAARRLITIVGADHDRFHLVYAENVNYGMRRNLLGLKPIGIWVACLAGLVALALLMFAAGALRQRAARYAPGLGVSVLAVFFWAAIVNPQWVRVPAEEYATRLMESVELLLADRAASSSS